MPCRIHTMFNDPTCIYCNAQQTRYAQQQKLKNQQRQMAYQYKQDRKAKRARVHEENRQRSLQFQQEQRAKKAAKRRKDPTVKDTVMLSAKIVLGVLACWIAILVFAWYEREWILFVFFFVIGAVPIALAVWWLVRWLRRVSAQSQTSAGGQPQQSPSPGAWHPYGSPAAGHDPQMGQYPPPQQSPAPGQYPQAGAPAPSWQPPPGRPNPLPSPGYPQWSGSQQYPQQPPGGPQTPPPAPGSGTPEEA